MGTATLRGHALRLLLAAIKIVEPCKNTSLSQALRQLADEYDTRPTGRPTTDGAEKGR